MGYTHYMRLKNNNLTPKTAGELHGDVAIVLEDFKDIIQFEDDRASPPINNGGVIRFNGIGVNGHETFGVSLKDNSVFDFCKTARKPYDLPVCIVLLLLKFYLGKSIEVSSDGDFDDEWLPAYDYFNRVLSPIVGAAVKPTDTYFEFIPIKNF